MNTSNLDIVDLLDIQKNALRVFVCTDHDCFYPVGVCSVIVAKNEANARTLLDEKLIERGLKPFSEYEYTFYELNIGTSSARIFLDGDY